MIDLSIYKKRILDIFKRILQHPAFLVVLFHAFVIISINGINPNLHSQDIFVKGLGHCTFAPLFAFAIICLDRYTKGLKFKPSWLLVPVYLVLSYIPSLELFYEHTAFFVLTFAAAPLAYLSAKRRAQDEAFVRTVVRSVLNAAFAGVFTGVLALLLLAFNESIDFLFNINGLAVKHFFLVAEFFCLIMICPSLFVALDEDDSDRSSFEKIIQTILNYAVSPALVLYTGILYAYIIKIIVQWNLPKGGVAYMVMAYGAILILTKAYQMIQDKKPFEWFYKRSWAISIPILCLFWVGVFRRISDYGVTSPRYYLVLVGIFLCLFLLLKNGKKLYHSLFTALCATLILSVTVPGVNQKAVSLLSQKAIVKAHALSAGILSDSGKFADGAYTCDNNEQAEHFRRVFQSLQAIYKLDSKAIEKFGISDCQSFIDRLPDNLKDNVYSSTPLNYIETEEDKLNGEIFLYFDGYPVNIEGYSTALENKGYEELENNLESWGFDKENLILQQLEKCGVGQNKGITKDWLQENKNDFLVLRNDNFMVIIDCSVELDNGTITSILYPEAHLVLKKN